MVSNAFPRTAKDTASVIRTEVFEQFDFRPYRLVRPFTAIEGEVRFALAPGHYHGAVEEVVVTWEALLDPALFS